jgi:hypothetical protein
MNLRAIRIGELVAAGGCGCVIAALLLPWYQSPAGNLDAWDTFGPAIALLLAALCAALAMFFSALTEQGTAVPVAVAVWCVPLGLAAVVSAVVRVTERPDHATGLLAGAWLALIGAAAILIGAWLAMRDERASIYPPASPRPRPRP